MGNLHRGRGKPSVERRCIVSLCTSVRKYFDSLGFWSAPFLARSEFSFSEKGAEHNEQTARRDVVEMNPLDKFSLPHHDAFSVITIRDLLPLLLVVTLTSIVTTRHSLWGYPVSDRGESLLQPVGCLPRTDHHETPNFFQKTTLARRPTLPLSPLTLSVSIFCESRWWWLLVIVNRKQGNTWRGSHLHLRRTVWY